MKLLRYPYLLHKKIIMAVLISSQVKGQTQEGYDSVLVAVREAVKAAPGFILHCAHPVEDGWLVTEIWESKKQADQWFGKFVVPNLPEGIHPKRSYQELHSMVTPNE
jgi:hypothetical protein